MTNKEQKKGITGTTLKIIAIVTMFIDHFAAILVLNYLLHVIPNDFQSAEEEKAWFIDHPSIATLNTVYVVMRLIGRFAFPLFAFLIVEGFQHTRSVKKYAINLGLFALISELPFNIGFSGKLFDPDDQNVFFTLFFGLLCITCIRYFAETKRDCEKFRPLFYLAAVLSGPFMAFMVFHDSMIGHIMSLMKIKMEVFMFYAVGEAAVVCTILFLFLGRKWDTAQRNTFAGIILSLVIFCALADFLRTDYGGCGVLTIAILYLLRRHKMRAFAVACLEITLFSVAEVTAFLMLIPVAFYNGKRGAKINKYVFYAFYPVHIGLLYLITLLLGFATFAFR